MGRKKYRVGVNYTSSRHFTLIKELIDARVVDFVEILIDNFLTVPAQSILEKFESIPLAFHIMNSRFLEEKEETKLQALAAPIRSLIRETRPLYVSDHVGRFTHNGCVLPILGEYDYRNTEHAVAAVDRWQSLLGTQLLLENFPSYTMDGMEQPAFFETVLQRTGAGLLFDVSNAIVAWHNTHVAPSAWNALVDGCNHYHAGGYSESEFEFEPIMLLDTHDRPLSNETSAAIADIMSRHESVVPTITIEFDRNIDRETWGRELERVAGLTSASTSPDKVLS